MVPLQQKDSLSKKKKKRKYNFTSNNCKARQQLLESEREGKSSYSACIGMTPHYPRKSVQMLVCYVNSQQVQNKWNRQSLTHIK